jgi:hypothetical protein
MWKGASIRGWYWSSKGIKLCKIESLKPIRVVIERNHKSRDWIELYQNDVVLVKLIFFFIFVWKDYLGGYFSGAFNVSSLHQFWQNLHENDGLTFDYTSIWSFLVNWQYNGHDVGPKRPTQAVFNCQIW